MKGLSFLFSVGFLLKYNIPTEVVSEHLLNFHAGTVSLETCTAIKKQNITNIQKPLCQLLVNTHPPKAITFLDHFDHSLACLILNFIQLDLYDILSFVSNFLLLSVTFMHFTHVIASNGTLLIFTTV